MRLLLSTFIAFTCLCVPVQAQDVITSNAAEGAGLLISDVDGALPKGMWRTNPRSEITYLLKTLPAEAPFKSLQQIKRNMLISTYDTSAIDNDVAIKVGEDLLTLRLAKLMELGLWEDAAQLYSNTTSDPGQNDDLAQIGVLLSLYKQGLAAACLENKAFGARFTSKFWEELGLICGEALNNEKIISTQFPDSPVFRGIYTEPDYLISANDLAPLSFLELMIANIENKITYSNFTLSPATPPRIIRVFLNDEQFPAGQKTALQSLAESKVVAISDSKKEEKNPSESNFDNQLTNNIQMKDKISPLLEAAQYVENNQKIPNNVIQKLLDNAGKNQENIFFLQLLSSFGLTDISLPFSEEQLTNALNAFPELYKKELQILKSWLDNSSEFSNNPSKVYEKQINLADGENFTPSNGDWTKWLGKTTSHQLTGLSLLIVLNNNKNQGVRYDQLLNDLRTVGLIEQAHQVARDMTARLMRIKNN